MLVAALPDYGVGNTTDAVVGSLRDGGQEIQLNANGVLHGLLPIPSAFQEALAIGVPGTVTPIAPPQTRVLSDRPVFTWHPHPGANAYQVVVTADALAPLQRSGRVPDP